MTLTAAALNGGETEIDEKSLANLRTVHTGTFESWRRSVVARVGRPPTLTAMNRMDRLYALVEELRAAGSPGRSARWLAERFEVSVRTIERDILALQEAGVPISAQLGRRGGYVLDRSMSLPPLNFTPAEAVALAVGLRRLDDTPWARDARTALLKVVAAMPERAAARARTLADRVRLLVQPLSAPDQAIADAVVRAVEEATPILIDYLDVGGRPTVRQVEPHHVVLGPNGSYVTGWCRLRQDERVFRIDRIRSVEPLTGTFQRPVREYGVEDYETRIPAWE
jgi:predicted DNA-binding transcriptional regulator YafY